MGALAQVGHHAAVEGDVAQARLARGHVGEVAPVAGEHGHVIGDSRRRDEGILTV